MKQTKIDAAKITIATALIFGVITLCLSGCSSAYYQPKIKKDKCPAIHFLRTGEYRTKFKS